MIHSCNFGSAASFFLLLILYYKKSQEVHKNFISCFVRKKRWAWSKLSKATVTIGCLKSQDMIPFLSITGCLNSQAMIRILKQSGHDFSGKCLCDEYCMDIMGCLEVNI